mmetsp:Transcript_1814/g.1503  ORF Transcript_1814/g.1503 Transcript_1814/m.1503 type:complete len:186 (+) Transcript_1814:311-868(+)
MNFLAFGMEVQSSVIINLGQFIAQGDVMVCISFALECITIIGAFPLVVYPQRSSIVHFVSACLPPKNEWSKRVYGWIVVVIIIGLSYAVAIALPDVNVMLGLVGSLTGSIVTFYSPAAFILKISKKPLLTFDLEHIICYIQIAVRMVLNDTGPPASSTQARSGQTTIEQFDAVELARVNQQDKTV